MSDKSFEQLVASLPSYGVRSGSLVKGRVVSMSNDYVTVDVGLKSEALVPFSEFVQSNNEDISEGAELDFLLETIDNGFGETCVSLEKAIRLAVWNRLENALKSEENVVGLEATPEKFRDNYLREKHKCNHINAKTYLRGKNKIK